MSKLKILLCSARSPKYDVLCLASRRATAAMDGAARFNWQTVEEDGK